MSRGRHPIPEDVQQVVIAMYGRGKTLKECSAAYGKSDSWAWHIVRKRVPRKRQRLPRVTSEQLAIVVREYAAGRTRDEAAKVAGCSAYTAWKHLNSLGLITTPHRRGAALDAEGEAAIRERYRSGLTAWEIARETKLEMGRVLEVVYGPRKLTG